MIYDRIWPHWMGEREVKQELDRLEMEKDALDWDYRDEWLESLREADERGSA